MEEREEQAGDVNLGGEVSGGGGGVAASKDDGRLKPCKREGGGYQG